MIADLLFTDTGEPSAAARWSDPAESWNAPPSVSERQRVRIAVQGHAPISAATQAVFETLKAVREGASPKQLKGLAPAELMSRVTRDGTVKRRAADFLGLKS